MLKNTGVDHPPVNRVSRRIRYVLAMRPRLAVYPRDLLAVARHVAFLPNPQHKNPIVHLRPRRIDDERPMQQRLGLIAILQRMIRRRRPIHIRPRLARRKSHLTRFPRRHTQRIFRVPRMLVQSIYFAASGKVFRMLAWISVPCATRTSGPGVCGARPLSANT